MLTSIVIPCYQNENQLVKTVEAIQTHISLLSSEFELILVDDGSTDSTWDKIEMLANRQQNIGGISLKQNIGAYNALIAGFMQTRGSAILVMAADGDDPPELIPTLVKRLEHFDAVLANRAKSEKGPIHNLISKLVYRFLKFIGAKNIPAGGSDFMIFRRIVFDRCLKKGFAAGNTLIQLIQHTDNVCTVPYTKGKSKQSDWTFAKKMKLLFQTVNQFIFVPWTNNSSPLFSIQKKAGLLRSFDK